ncbi:MAG TPA: HAMP domain-containing sensor histidine kinase [Acidobacteriaceae bacterium]|nr:HAMP domain-containing sensor histidine kinase [Acidobacteriaceae bacterium]
MFDDVTLMPHAVCWAAAPRLIWTMVVTNAITFLSYVSICIILLVLASRTRRVIAKDWAYFLVGFALFIAACGSTHAMEVVTTWIPLFWIDAFTNLITAVLSAYVAVMFARRVGEIAFGINDYAARLARTEQEKRVMKESLLAAQKLEDWSRMSAVLAHEINNPLESIQNSLYLIRTSGGVPAEVTDLAKMASEETTRVIELARSTLGFFRHSAEPEPVDMARVVDSVRFLLAPLIRRGGIALEATFEGDMTVQAFPGEVRQVLLNLIRNACEATPGAGGQVRVTVTGQPQGVEIVVADEGSGIDPQVLPRLFQFGSTTKGEGGNGMGLWTVKHIVTRHGGTIDVASTLGEGAKFTLWWPREYVEMSSPSASFEALAETA